ncbi:MAG: F0F1 ATP synthase subunit C [Candidatus Rifleibacteriota bacterium]
MDLSILAHSAEVLGAAFSIAIGSGMAAYAMSKVISQTIDSISRQPEMSGDLRFIMIIGLAMIESLAIYCLLVSLILLFVKW